MSPQKLGDTTWLGILQWNCSKRLCNASNDAQHAVKYQPCHPSYNIHPRCMPGASAISVGSSLQLVCRINVLAINVPHRSEPRISFSSHEGRDRFRRAAILLQHLLSSWNFNQVAILITARNILKKNGLRKFENSPNKFYLRAGLWSTLISALRPNISR